MGCAKDIVEHCGVPRFVFSDFPLGNAAGRPNDPQSQADTLALALRVLETAPGPRTTVQSPQRWRDDAQWKLDFSNLDRLSPEEYRAFHDLNARYGARFGFPFIICVRLTNKAGILAAMEQRLAHDEQSEIATALAEIGRIVALRLEDLA